MSEKKVKIDGEWFTEDEAFAMMNGYTIEEMKATDRDRAILWAREMTERGFVIVDTETTGLDDWAEICEIAAINNRREILLNTRIKPTCSIPPGATSIHGITDTDVAEAPTFDKVRGQIEELGKDSAIVIYNFDYDYRLLYQSYRPYTQDPYPVFWRQTSSHCAMNKFAAFYGAWNEHKAGYTWQRLTHAAAHFGIDTRGAHGALADCTMTLGVVQGMAAAKLSTEKGE